MRRPGWLAALAGFLGALGMIALLALLLLVCWVLRVDLEHIVEGVDD